MGQIKDERARLSGLVETAADAIIVIDTQGVIQQTNSAVSRLFGYAPDELVGSNVKLLMAPEDAQRHDGYLRNYRKTGVGSIIGVGREVVARRANGELIQVYLSVGEFSAHGESYYVGILHDITDHKRMEAELVRLAQTDELTGAFNRRHFMSKLEAEIHRSNRYRHPLSLMIIDLDHFKRVNDTYGHAVGDLALRAVVELLRGELREQDELARLGGDEFAVLLPETRVDIAQGVANRVIARAGSTRIDETDERLSLSIGVAGWKLGMTNGGLLRDADAALYEAKAAGRGRVYSLKDGD
jgi:diguanylate cyclase (GGDEF)-like protein/PAS domain S-box-containing protein